MPGRPSREQAEVDLFTTSTGLKFEPAAPVPSSATSFSWLATQGEGGPVWVEVVVVEDALVVDVVGARVVEVDVGAVVVEVDVGAVVVVVVVGAGVAA
jgi:hypothetical protein